MAAQSVCFGNYLQLLVLSRSLSSDRAAADVRVLICQRRKEFGQISQSNEKPTLHFMRSCSQAVLNDVSSGCFKGHILRAAPWC